jgi:hypothetical protein
MTVHIIICVYPLPNFQSLPSMGGSRQVPQGSISSGSKLRYLSPPESTAPRWSADEWWAVVFSARQNVLQETHLFSSPSPLAQLLRPVQAQEPQVHLKDGTLLFICGSKVSFYSERVEPIPKRLCRPAIFQLFLHPICWPQANKERETVSPVLYSLDP